MRTHRSLSSLATTACFILMSLGALGAGPVLPAEYEALGPDPGFCPSAGRDLRPPRPPRAATRESAPSPEAITNIDFVSHTRLGAPYSHCAAVDTARKRIYGGFGTTFAVFSTADPTHPRLLGWVETGGVIYGVHYSGSGDSVYVAATDAGILRMDVATPAAPVIAASNTEGGNLYAIEATLNGGHLYVADYWGFLRICDPTTLAVETSVDLGLGGYGANEVFVLGTYAYVGCTTAFVVVDLGVAPPVRVNAFDLAVADPIYPPEVMGVSVQVQGTNTYAYLGVYDSSASPLPSFYVLDVTNPLAPLTALAADSVTSGGGFDLVTVAAGSTYTMYLVDVLSGVRTLDVTDPSAPVDSQPAYPAPGPSGLVVVGSTAYYSDTIWGIQILSLAGGAPALLGTCDGTYGVRGIAAAGRYVYHATYDGLKVVDVSIPGRPSTVGALPGVCTTTLKAPSTLGGRYLIGSTSSSVQIVDVAVPTAPLAHAAVSVGTSVNDLTVEEGFAYVAAGIGGLHIVGLADLDAPTLEGSYTPASVNFRSVGVRERTVYLADYSNTRLHVVDASDPAAPAPLASLTVSGRPYSISVHGNLLLVGSNLYLDIFDISNPTTPSWITSYRPTSNLVRMTKMVGSTAYVATANGLNVLDLSMPWAPVEVAQYEPGGVYGWCLDYDGGYVYLGTISSGGFMIHVTGSCDDRYEPNDDLVEAWTVQPGRLYDAKLCEATDADYYEVAPGAGGTVALTLQPPVGQNYDLLLFDAANSLLASALTAGDAVERLAYTSSAPGPFFALVRGSDGTQFSRSANYSLQYTFTACPAPTLPAYIYMGRRDINNNAVFDVQDPNQPATRTGYNLYRSDSPSGPFTLIAGNMVDMDEGTANVQLVDVNSATGGPYYYEIRDVNGACGAEGP